MNARTRNYLTVYVALMLLLLLTIASSLIGFGGFQPLINFAIAAAKAVLVVVFFMHLQQHGGLTRIFALGGLLWLGVLFGLTLSDYLTRS
jgi:cytochrome c oxidase subunit 4